VLLECECGAATPLNRRRPCERPLHICTEPRASGCEDAVFTLRPMLPACCVSFYMCSHDHERRRWWVCAPADELLYPPLLARTSLACVSKPACCAFLSCRYHHRRHWRRRRRRHYHRCRFRALAARIWPQDPHQHARCEARVRAPRPARAVQDTKRRAGAVQRYRRDPACVYMQLHWLAAFVGRMAFCERLTSKAGCWCA